MTAKKIFLSAAVIPAAVLILQGCISKKVTAGSDIITTVFVVGNAEILHSGNSAEKLTTGRVIAKNDIIKTGVKSSVTLQAGNLSTLRINENSEFAFITFHDNGTTEISLVKGEIFSKVLKLSKDEQYKIKTPVCVAAVRGTQFLVNAGAAKSSVKVLDGKVAVKAVAGKQEEKTAVENIGIDISAADAVPAARELEEAETLTLQKYALYEYDAKLDGKSVKELQMKEQELLKKEEAADQKIKTAAAENALLTPIEKLRKKGKPLTMLYLRDGSQLVGSVISSDGSRLTLDTGEGAIQIPTGEIVRRVMTK